MGTKTETEKKTTEVVTVKGSVLKVRYPLFIMFAEYIGYVSPLIEWAEELCKGHDLPSYKKSILRADALSIYHQVMNDFPLASVKELYMDYYQIILEDYDRNLCHIEDKAKDDLPF